MIGIVIVSHSAKLAEGVVELARNMGGEDIRIQAEEVLKDKILLNSILAKHTGQDPEKIAKEIERDRYMNAQEALAYGLVDEILVEPEKDKKKKKP
jgi:ATP-dependent Clp protease protease subunit